MRSWLIANSPALASDVINPMCSGTPLKFDRFAAPGKRTCDIVAWFRLDGARRSTCAFLLDVKRTSDPTRRERVTGVRNLLTGATGHRVTRFASAYNALYQGYVGLGWVVLPVHVSQNPDRTLTHRGSYPYNVPLSCTDA